MHVDERQLSDFLIDGGLISRSALADARVHATDTNETLYRTLLRGGMVDSDHLRRAAAHTLGVPFVILEVADISPEALVYIPEPVSRMHNIVAFRTSENMLEVAVLDLDDLEAIEFLQSSLPYKVSARLTDSTSIKRGLQKYQQHLKEKFGSFAQHGLHPVDALIKHAIYRRAGGIHIEPSMAGFLVRYRIGEMLHEAIQLPEHVGKLLIEQLKSMAKVFPVAAAQEGRFTVEHDNETHVVHLSTMPLHKGEKLVMRLTKEKRGGKGSSLESLGFHGTAAEALYRALRAKSGLILVASPDATSKQTLLYALLEQLNYPDRALASVEEATTQHVPHVAQASTKTSKLSFATLLRTTLKHDPDVVMVGSIPNGEVALLAAEAAGQGKLVIAGVEASSAAEGIQEMLRFGVSPLVLASVLRAALATQTLRGLCPNCRTTHRINRQESSVLEQGVDFGRVFGALKEEGVVEGSSSWKELDFYWPEGCGKCEVGYIGEVGIQEIMPISSPIKELILHTATQEELQAQAMGEGMLTLAEDGLFKAAQGKTSIQEVFGMVSRPN